MTTESVKVLPSTDPTAIPVALDDVDGIKHPLYKSEFGEDGEATMVSSDDPLPVTDTGTDNPMLAMAEAIDTKLAIIIEHLSRITKEKITENEIEDN